VLKIQDARPEWPKRQYSPAPGDLRAPIGKSVVCFDLTRKGATQAIETLPAGCPASTGFYHCYNGALSTDWAISPLKAALPQVPLFKAAAKDLRAKISVDEKSPIS
jgi:hypothetical protein